MDKKPLLTGPRLFAAGMLLLLFATKIGLIAGAWHIWANGGTYLMERYEFIIKSTALSCQIGGGICALLGGAAFLGRKDGN